MRNTGLGDRLSWSSGSHVLSSFPRLQTRTHGLKRAAEPPGTSQSNYRPPSRPTDLLCDLSQSLALSGPYSLTLSISDPLVVLAVWVFVRM